MFFYICYKLDNNIKENSLFFNEFNKFTLYKKLINSNFNDDELLLFTKAQNIYHKLNNFCLKYKFKKYKPGNDNDMYLDPINISNKNTIKILIDNRIYLFTVKDINHIINTHLLHNNYSNELLSLNIRNPYTNNIIKLHNLYNIFFSLKNRNIFNHTFYIFYKKNFNIDKILIEYRYLLYYNLYKYNITHSSNKYLYDNIIKMFESLNDYFKIVYFLNYDQKTIINKYKNLLIHYFIYLSKESSINTSIINKLTLIKKVFDMIEREKIFDVLKKNEIFKLIHFDYLNDNYLSYITGLTNNNQQIQQEAQQETQQEAQQETQREAQQEIQRETQQETQQELQQITKKKQINNKINKLFNIYKKKINKLFYLFLFAFKIIEIYIICITFYNLFYYS